MENNNSSVKKWVVITSDGERVEVKDDVMKMFESLELGDYDGEVPLDLTGEEMRFVVKFVEQHFPYYGIVCRPKGADLADWEKAFITAIPTQAKLFQLIMVANKFHIRPLLDLTCCYVASLIKGKTPEEIRQSFSVDRK